MFSDSFSLHWFGRSNRKALRMIQMAPAELHTYSHAERRDGRRARFHAGTCVRIGRRSAFTLEISAIEALS